MLGNKALDDDLQAAPLAYMLYDAKGKLAHHNDTLFKMFPALEGENLVGLTRVEIRSLLKNLEKATKKALRELEGSSAGDRRRSAKDGVFELSPGRFYVIDDLPLPEGVLVTIVRDVTQQKNRRESVERLQAALRRLASEEAIYNGDKAVAFKLFSEIILNTLSASRADVWLMNVDATTIHQQEITWDDGKNHRAMKVLEKSQCPALFQELQDGRVVASTDLVNDERLKGLVPQSARDKATQAILIVPILRGPRTIGAVFVAESKSYRKWRDEEVSFVQYAADMVVRMLEAHDRLVAEEGLRSFNEVLDERVRHRTSELEEALETLKLAQSELVRSEKLASLGGLVAGVAHEINTPLGVALTSVTHMQDEVARFDAVLESGKIKKSDLDNFVDVTKETTVLVQRNLDRAAHLIRSFRMVAVDQAMGDSRRLMLGQYLEELVDSLKPTLRKNGVLVVLDCKKDIQIETVPGDLAHIVTNLIMNAALHGFKGGGPTKDKRVRVSSRKRGDYVYIDVSDNGIGIADDIKDKIFEPFFTTARADGGSGLGLNIVYNTVYQKLQGKIEIGDAEEGGALFKIRFPIFRENA